MRYLCVQEAEERKRGDATIVETNEDDNNNGMTQQNGDAKQALDENGNHELVAPV
jgi:hypothetical protein